MEIREILETAEHNDFKFGVGYIINPKNPVKYKNNCIHNFFYFIKIILVY